jgi:hypothetical protein
MYQVSDSSTARITYDVPRTAVFGSGCIERSPGVVLQRPFTLTVECFETAVVYGFLFATRHRTNDALVASVVLAWRQYEHARV